MKKYLLIAVAVCCLVLCSYIKASAEPVADAQTEMQQIFPDKVFRKYILDNFDTDKDGSLSLSEILSVTKIDVHYNSWSFGNGVSEHVNSLKGIEHFTNLISLDCHFQEGLSSIDVSKNTKLTELKCSYNRLYDLDVSNNTALTTLNCSGNRLMILDVSKNTKLTKLYCSDNKFTELDLSNLLGLTELECGDNPLKKIDVSPYTKLESLSCAGCMLTTLDVGKNTELTLLSCGHNQLTALDVSKNRKLEILNCVANQLSNLDLSKNSVLARLDCGENQIEELDLSKTNLFGGEWNTGDESAYHPLECAPMETLKRIYLKKGWCLVGINDDWVMYDTWIPKHTEIIYVD